MYVFTQRKIREFLHRLRLTGSLFAHLFEQAEIAKFNREELRSYRESQKDYWDWCAVTETAERKGRAQGMVEGMQKGKAEGILSTARSLKAMGVLSVNQIAEATGLSVDEIVAL